MLQKTVFTFADGNSKPDYTGFNFGAAKEPKDGAIQLVSGTHTCREGLFHNMRTRITAGKDNQPTDRMRMIFRWYGGNGAPSGYQDECEAWAMRAAAVLKAFDKLAGWPLTRVYKLDVGSKSDWLQAYYFWSSRRWMKASYLVSLYVLLVRMCKDTRIDGFKDFDSMVKKIQKALDSSTNLKSDHTYVRTSLPYWKSIMLGYPDLFRAKKMPYYWDTSRISGSSGGSEGIQYLCNGDTNYTEVRSLLLKIKKEVDKTGTYKPKPPKKKAAK